MPRCSNGPPFDSALRSLEVVSQIYFVDRVQPSDIQAGDRYLYWALKRWIPVIRALQVPIHNAEAFYKWYMARSGTKYFTKSRFLALLAKDFEEFKKAAAKAIKGQQVDCVAMETDLSMSSVQAASDVALVKPFHHKEQAGILWLLFSPFRIRTL
jgi:hypothetical protein